MLKREKTARIFNNGGSQAVRLPAEFRFDGSEVFIRRDERTGDIVLSRKKRWTSWEEFFTFRDAALRDSREDSAEEFVRDRPLNVPSAAKQLFDEDR